MTKRNLGVVYLLLLELLLLYSVSFKLGLSLLFANHQHVFNILMHFLNQFNLKCLQPILLSLLENILVLATYVLLADVNKRTFIDRFARSVAYHGPSLISLAKYEQGDGEGSATDFLCPNTADHLAVNYFRNRLQVSMKQLRNYL